MPEPDAPATRPQPSIADVAALAGVSGQTVSRVANGSSRVAADTRRRVLDAMAEVGYAPNVAARALRGGDFKTIGVLAHRLGHTGEARTVEAIAAAARKHGQAIALIDVEGPDARDFEDAAARLTHQAISALVIVRADIDDPTRLHLPAGLPVFASDRRFEGRFPTIGTDEGQGVAAAVEHLVGLGHRTVHHIAGPARSWAANARLDAWKEALVDAGLTAPAPVRGDWTAESGRLAVHELAERGSAPTALLVGNDEMAIGAIRGLAELGRRVPEDVSVVGFDDIPLAAYTTPPLTTVRQDFERIGRELVEAVLGTRGDGTVPAELIVRDSTSAPTR